MLGGGGFAEDHGLPRNQPGNGPTLAVWTARLEDPMITMRPYSRGLLVGTLLAALGDSPHGSRAGGGHPGPTSVTIAGSLQSELGCPGDWDPACAATRVAADAADDVWQGIVRRARRAAYEYKVALNDSWDENYGAGAGQRPEHRARRWPRRRR